MNPTLCSKHHPHFLLYSCWNIPFPFWVVVTHTCILLCFNIFIWCAHKKCCCKKCRIFSFNFQPIYIAAMPDLRRVGLYVLKPRLSSLSSCIADGTSGPSVDKIFFSWILENILYLHYCKIDFDGKNGTLLLKVWSIYVYIWIL